MPVSNKQWLTLASALGRSLLFDQEDPAIGREHRISLSALKVQERDWLQTVLEYGYVPHDK